MVHIDDESCHVLGEITVTSGLGIIFKLYVAPVNTFPHGDQVKSLWERNYGREGLQLDVKPSMLPLGSMEPSVSIQWEGGLVPRQSCLLLNYSQQLH